MLKTSILISLIGLVLQHNSVNCAAVSVSPSGDPSSSSQTNGMSYNNRNNQPSQYGSNVIPSISGYSARGMSYMDSPPTPMRFPPAPATGFGMYNQQPNQFNTPPTYQYSPYNSYGNVPTFSYYGQPNPNQYPAPSMSSFGNQPGMPPYHQQFGHQPSSFGQSPQFPSSPQLPSPDGNMPSMFNRNSLSKSDDSGKKPSQ